MVDVAAVKARLGRRFKGRIVVGAPLADFTTFHIGGPADLVAIPRGPEDLKRLAYAVTEAGAALLVLGRGSNVLVSDRGFRGVAAVLSGGMGRIKKKGKDEAYVEGGCDLNRLISWAIELGLGGLEDLYGIPGSVGGAVRMNAGAWGSCIGDTVEEVEVLRLEEGDVHERRLTAEEMGFAYRHTRIGDNEIIYEVKLKLHRSDRVSLESRRREVMGWRMENQPLGQASAGSVFRNPEGVAAGALIERCGLKGMRVGEAMVSDVHANFIVNLGGARAQDVYRLMEQVKREVRQREGIQLEEEIRLVGEMGESGS